jgi:hypothetical protein
MFSFVKLLQLSVLIVEIYAGGDSFSSSVAGE